MKRFLLAVMVLITLICCTACTIFPNYLLKIDPQEISKMEIERISDGLLANYANGSNNIVKTLNEINSVLFFKHDGCESDEEMHEFKISFETEDGNLEIFLNNDGSVCFNQVHYVVDFSSKATINKGIFERMVNASNVKEEEKEEVIDTEEEPVIETEEIDIQELANSIISVNDYTDLAIVNGKRYFIADANVLNENCNILASEGSNNNITLYFKVESAKEIQYVDGSYEQSGGKKLYFNIISEDGITDACYLDIEAGKCLSISSGNTSNFVVFEAPVSTAIGLGWIIADDSIVPIDLATGETRSDLVINIKEEVKANVINNHFFENNIEGYDYKNTTISTLENDKLIITVTETSPEDLPDIVTEFIFSCVDRTINQR